MEVEAHWWIEAVVTRGVGGGGSKAEKVVGIVREAKGHRGLS